MVTKVFALVLLSTLNSLATSDSYDTTQGSKDTCTTYESVQSTICHDGASCSRIICASETLFLNCKLEVLKKRQSNLIVHHFKGK